MNLYVALINARPPFAQRLAEALRVQRSARLQVRSMQVQLDETGQLRG